MNNQTQKSKLFRQGDILIREVHEIPKNLRRDKQADRYILAEGEITGHHHVLESVEGLEVYTGEGPNEIYLSVAGEPTVLSHPEHASIDIPLGEYKVVRQREFVDGVIDEARD